MNRHDADSSIDHHHTAAQTSSVLEQLQARRIIELQTILDDFCDWAQHVAAPEDNPIHFIVERAEAALKGKVR